VIDPKIDEEFEDELEAIATEAAQEAAEQVTRELAEEGFALESESEFDEIDPAPEPSDEDDELGPLDGLTQELTYSDEDEVAETIPTDDDGYLAPVEGGADEPLVVVQDYDPADPGAPIAEPQKVLKPHDRIQRKRDRGSRE